MSNYKCIALDEVTNTKVARIVDERVMDPERIELLGKELLSLGENSADPRVVVDFSTVRFFSSAAINKLIVMEKRLRARGGRIGLCNMTAAVRDLFSFTHLDELFSIYPDTDSAVQAIRTNETDESAQV